MKMIIRELTEQGISENDILYFNLDKRPYIGITKAEQLDELIEKNYRQGTVQYLFIDEVQNVKTDNRINYGPALENIVFNYAVSKDYKASVGRIGKLECDFILRGRSLSYSYVQVAYTILASKETEDREYRSLESIAGDNYPKYVMTTDKMIQNRNGISHINLMDFVIAEKDF